MSNSLFDWPMVGHKNIIDFLQNSIKKDRLSHAYIFCGVEHLGKKKLAKYLSKSILCGSYHKANSTPCNKCIHCRGFNDNIHPDLIIIKRLIDKKTGKLKKNISIEQIKEMKNRLNLSSFLKGYKIAIIEESEKMSQNATDSLLKTLEEPSKKTILILLTSQIQDLPLTIVSRCQKIKFLPLSFSDIYDYLVNVKNIKRNSALNLASIVQGRPGLIQYFSEENLKKQYQDIENNLNLINQPYYKRIEFIDNMLSKKIGSEDQKKIVLNFFNQWEMILRSWLLQKNSSLNILGYMVNNIKIDNEKYQNNKLIIFLNKIRLGKIYLKSNVSPKLILENFILTF